MHRTIRREIMYVHLLLFSPLQSPPPPPPPIKRFSLEPVNFRPLFYETYLSFFLGEDMKDTLRRENFILQLDFPVPSSQPLRLHGSLESRTVHSSKPSDQPSLFCLIDVIDELTNIALNKVISYLLSEHWWIFPRQLHMAICLRW